MEITIFRFLIICLLLCVFSVKCVKKLPSYLEQCYRGDDNEMGKCLLRNIDNLRPRLDKGIAELLIPPMAPLRIPKAIISNERTFKSELTDIELYHLEKPLISRLHMSSVPGKEAFDLEMEYTTLGMVTRYHMQGKLLVLELDSIGHSKGNMTDVKINIHADLGLVKRNGKDHLAVKSSSTNASIGFSHIVFDNIFGNNKELNDNANKILNDNYKVFLEEFKPAIETIIRQFVTHTIDDLYRKYPYDVLFPEKPKQ